MNRVRDIVNANSVHKNNILGSGACIAVLDSGIANHPDFGTRIRGWYDTVNGRLSPYDDNGHGTHVAGIAAGSGAASHGSLRGMAPSAELVSVKILDQYGEGMIPNILKGINWVIKNRLRYGINIVNISVGTTDGKRFDENSNFVKKVNELWDMGIVVAASAGNKGPEPYSISAPGNSRKIITVGYYSKQSNSSVGPTTLCIKKPDVVTPGQQITSCSHSFATGNAYIRKSGTSMATPVVSGSIALLLSKYPYLTPKEVKLRLKNSCTDLNLPHSNQGWGLLNVENLLS
ncbi:MAG: S8 family peptidase [Roseburia sp.]|nr:S8 family peptidase [Roseburia sp.]